MHIPDNYLSPSTCGVFGLVMIPIWGLSIKKIKRDIPREKIAFIGVFAAFSFLLMMFNVPLPGGTTGHAVGATLIAILFGPEVACIAVSVALLIQAVVFGDGGILAFGANCFNMAFVAPFAGYAIYRLIRDHAPANWGDKVGAALGSYVGINVAALCAAIEFGIQPLMFTDAAGMALYCPYPLAVSIPAMCIPHLLVVGVIEAIATVGIYSFVKKAAPDFIVDPNLKNADGTPVESFVKTSLQPVYMLIAALVVATPLGLLAQGEAWGEWGAADIAETGVGYTPAAIADGFDYSALFPDYSLASMPDAFAYLLSAVIGVALLVILFKVIGLMASRGRSVS